MNDTTTDQAFPEIHAPKVTARVATMREFRKRYRRIDYYPSPAALAELDKVRALNPGRTIGQLIDHLVTLACNPASGNTRK